MRPACPPHFPALTYLDPAQLAAADKVDISILARDPRSISTSAPEMAKSAGLEVTRDPDGKPENIAYNEELLPWLGGSGRSNYVRFFLCDHRHPHRPDRVRLGIADLQRVRHLDRRAQEAVRHVCQRGRHRGADPPHRADRSRGHRGDRHPAGHPGRHRRGRDPGEAHPGGRLRVDP